MHALRLILCLLRYGFCVGFGGEDIVQCAACWEIEREGNAAHRAGAHVGQRQQQKSKGVIENRRQGGGSTGLDQARRRPPC